MAAPAGRPPQPSADQRIGSLQQQVDQVKAYESVLRAQSAISARHTSEAAAGAPLDCVTEPTTIARRMP